MASKEPTIVGQMMFATLAMQFNLQQDHPTIREEVRNEILKWMEADPGIVRSNMGGWHSKPTPKGS